MSKKIIESYRKKLAAEEGHIISRGAALRIALCYPNTYAIGMANLGLHTMYELFNAIPDVVCEGACSSLRCWPGIHPAYGLSASTALTSEMPPTPRAPTSAATPPAIPTPMRQLPSVPWAATLQSITRLPSSSLNRRSKVAF